MDDDILDDGSDSQPFPNKSLCGGLSCENVSSDAASLKLINQVLMEDYDGLEYIDTMIQKSVLDTTEKSLYDVLYNNSIVFPSHEAQLHIYDNDSSFHSGMNADHNNLLLKDSDNSSVQWNYINSLHGQTPSDNQKDHLLSAELIENVYNDLHQVEDDDLGEMRNENLSSYDAEPWLVDLFSSAMSLCDPSSMDLNEKRQTKRSTRKGSFSTRKRKKEAVDLRALLLKCMEYLLLKSDHEEAKHLLSQIQQLSSPTGNGSQRLAHYFAIGIEAHLADKNLLNKNLMLYTDLNVHIPDMLKAYKLYHTALPLYKTSNYVATEKISKVTERASVVHLIHFGVNHGLHFPPIIQRLSKKPGGPPKLLRITGIEFPNYGLHPAERVKQTGKRLRKYCEELKISLEYNGFVRNWEDFSIEDLKLKGDQEVSVVMCFFNMHYLPDDKILENKSSRDSVLKLINEINPEIFIHGTVNATYSSPFLISRFREALFHFSVLFDMFDTILAVDDKDRMVYEEQWFGRQILNVVACEGPERVDRPESYKQWSVRKVRAGFRQVPMDGEIMEKVGAFMKKNYHKDFFVEESCQWMVQGWKGRAIIALSFWKPALRYGLMGRGSHVC